MHRSGFPSLFFDTEKVCRPDFLTSAATVCVLEEKAVAVGDSPLTAFHETIPEADKASPSQSNADSAAARLHKFIIHG